MIAKQMEELVNGSSVIRAMFEEGKKMAAEYGEDNGIYQLQNRYNT